MPEVLAIRRGPLGVIKLPITAGFRHLSQVKSEQVLGEKHGQKGGLGGEKGLGVKPVGIKVVFDFLDTLLHGGSGL